MDLLFALAHWHALAKLRQHTDLSLVILESATVQLGALLRNFQATTCAAYDTRELKRETAARMRQAANKPTANKPASDSNVAGAARTGAEAAPGVDEAAPGVDEAASGVDNAASTSPLAEAAASKPKKPTGRQRKTLNLNTYKDHSLGDYVESIRQNGTVDSYSTESASRASLSTLLSALTSFVDGA